MDALSSYITVKFTKLSDDAIPFKYIRSNDACMDVYSNVDTDLYPKEMKTVSTGIAVEIPNNFYGSIKGRSGLTSKGILVQLGTIDSDYRGDIRIMIYNSTNNTFPITKGMRIAQFSINPVIRINFVETNQLSDTNRNSNGFGSSGLY